MKKAPPAFSVRLAPALAGSEWPVTTEAFAAVPDGAMI